MKSIVHGVLQASFLLILAGCNIPAAQQAPTAKDAIDASGLPHSIHDKALPIGQQAGVVVSVTVSGTGAFDSEAMDGFINELKPRNAARKAAGKPLFFVAPAIDAHKVLFAGIANSKISQQDQQAVSQAMQDLAVDEDTAQSHVVLFFNDTPRTLKAAFAKDGTDLSVAVVSPAGEIVGRYALPQEKDAALQAVDSVLAP
jgi:hypothetical protein